MNDADLTKIATQPFVDLIGDDVVDFLCEHLPTKVSTRFVRALDHYTRASALVGIDEEMGMIRLIAAEEELVVAIFEQLKLKADEFPEHKDFVAKFRNHVVKLSFYPVLQQFKFAIGYMLKGGFVMEGIEDLMQFTTKPVVDGETIRIAVLKEDGEELIRHDPFDVAVSSEGVEAKDIVPTMLQDLEDLVKKQGFSTLKEFIKQRADFRNQLLYANDAQAMGRMNYTLSDLIEEFKETLRDLLWVLAVILGAKPPRIKNTLASQFIALYREVLIKAGVLKADNTPTDPNDLTGVGSGSNNVIEIMARADVDYFWTKDGKRFGAFEPTIAEGVRKRMRAIHAALNAAEYLVQKPEQK